METPVALAVPHFPQASSNPNQHEDALKVISHALKQTMSLLIGTRISLVVILCIFFFKHSSTRLYLDANFGELVLINLFSILLIYS